VYHRGATQTHTTQHGLRCCSFSVIHVRTRLTPLSWRACCNFAFHSPRLLQTCDACAIDVERERDYVSLRKCIPRNRASDSGISNSNFLSDRRARCRRVVGHCARMYSSRVTISPVSAFSGIYCSCYIDFYKEFRSDRVRKSGPAVFHVTKWSSVECHRRAELLSAREKYNKKHGNSSTLTMRADW
jgi:hypothetical protein